MHGNAAVCGHGPVWPQLHASARPTDNSITPIATTLAASILCMIGPPGAESGDPIIQNPPRSFREQPQQPGLPHFMVSEVGVNIAAPIAVSFLGDRTAF